MTFDEYEKNAQATAVYPGRGRTLGLMYVALKMNGESGEFAEHLGKAIRDDSYGERTPQLTPERRVLMIKEIGDVLWYLSSAAHELGTTLSEVARVNNEKLAKRYEENKIQGSGDNR